GVRRLRELAFLDAFLVIVVVAVTFALMTAVLARLVSAAESGEGGGGETALPVVTAEIPLGDFRFVVHGRAFSDDSGDKLYAIEFGAMALVTDTSPGIRRTERAIEARQFRIRG